ncbi:hypothetical protein K523DRAFT_263238 [Schizophyllum commune Tattone D]|nr:hypothetical protein K523DRAFT_263238 [Schizophyllum commune Tattone D]
MPTAPQAPQQTRPKEFDVSLRALLSLPRRIFCPPRVDGELRTFGVTPVFRIRLEDVLNRRHLPPLGLKDFEEWLLYVEKSPENLYFTLWLREYTIYYQHWLAQAKSSTVTSAGIVADQWLPTSPQLSMFYLRAKQTFLTPDADFELNVPSDLLAPFHAPTSSPYPDPTTFAPLAIQVRDMLQESLNRFVEAQFTNVGNQRAYCGIVAGAIFSLIGGVFPLLYNMFVHSTRWLRLTAIPGMWIGLIVFLSAMNGVCVGVYVFGDLRQLHKFELARPPISRPKPLAVQRNLISQPLAKTSALQSSVNVLPSSPTPPRVSISSERSDSGSSIYTSGSETSGSSGSSIVSEDPPFIQISPAYHDDDPTCGPAQPDLGYPADFTMSSGTETFVPTAAFIHPFDTISDFNCTLEEGDDIDEGIDAEVHQPMSPFDFDKLPPRIHPLPRRGFGRELDFVMAPPAAARAAQRSRWLPIVSRGQTICAPANSWSYTAPAPRTAYNKRAAEASSWATNSPQLGSPTPPWLAGGDLEKGAAHCNDATDTRCEDTDKRRRTPTEIKRGFNIVHAVPAFGVPLTRIRSPVIVRAQWEIVVRSAVLGFLICWAVVGALLAVPGTPTRH